MDMENSAGGIRIEQLQEEPASGRKKGGLITIPFIIANEALEKTASIGLMPNMILYLMKDYHLGVTQGANILNLWSSATNFTPLLGAFISDSYIGRFLTIGLGSIFSLLGMIVLWLTAMIPQARPPSCNQMIKGSCKSPTPSQYAALISSFALMSIGAGGIRPCSLAFGADQVDRRDSSSTNGKRGVLETFFSWYYAATAVAVIIAFTVIVYIQDHAGWKVGFGVPAILMFLSALFFFLASPFYMKQKASMSLFTSIAQVIVVTFKNRKLSFPPPESSEGYHHKKDSKLLKPTDNLRFLNKACIIRSPEDITPDGEARDPWSLCTAEQVEDLKVLIRVVPLGSTAILMSLNLSQGTFQLIQAKSMNRHITSGFQYPAGSFGMFTIAGAVLWIIIYDRAIIPLASKIRGKPVRIDLKTRMGLGIFVAILAMSAAAIVEHVRRKKAIASGFLNDASAVVDMSAMWLVPQHLLFGIAEAFYAVGQNEFFYSELPKRMSSLALALGGLGSTVGGFLATFVLTTVDEITKRGGKESWLSDNINKGHFESYYWLLVVIGSFNLLYFMLCSWAYGPCVEGGVFGKSGEDDLGEQELDKIGNGDHRSEKEVEA